MGFKAQPTKVAILQYTQFACAFYNTRRVYATKGVIHQSRQFACAFYNTRRVYATKGVIHQSRQFACALQQKAGGSRNKLEATNTQFAI
jgi:hypothetical protein